MNKREFLARLEEKIEVVERYQSSDIGDIDGLKAKLIPIIQQEFLDSVPKLLRRGKKIKIQSNGFKLEGEIGSVYYIVIENSRIKVGNWCDGLNVLQYELTEELSALVNREVKSITENNHLKFYFFW